MNKFAIALLTAALLAGCGQTTSEVNLQVEDLEDYIDWKDDQEDIEIDPFKGAEQRDLECLAHNNEASRRHSDINNDNWFNKREKNRPEDVRQKLREPKKRIAEKVCEVTHVENYIVFTAWVRPSGEVSDYIRAFTEAGVEQVSLFGFDFSNYDELYKEASVKAVKNAREKAEISARIAGTESRFLIASFAVKGRREMARIVNLNPYMHRLRQLQ